MRRRLNVLTYLTCGIAPLVYPAARLAADLFLIIAR